MHVAERCQCEVHVRVLSACVLCGTQQIVDASHHGGVLLLFAQHAQQFRRARVATGIERVAEAGQFVATLPARGDEG